jgi:CRISPR-associated protein Cas2
MNGFGDAVQYSVFLCDLSEAERQLLRQRLTDLLHLREDRALLVDLGPVDGHQSQAIEVLGRQLDAMPEPYKALII